MSVLYVVLPLWEWKHKREKSTVIFTISSGTDGKPVSCNSKVLAPNGKTVKTLPLGISGTPPLPTPLSSSFSLILFNKQDVVSEASGISKNKSEN